jgi:DNA-binding response OmpR family regulator
MDKKRILLVDDEPDLVRVVSLRLKASGYDVDVAYDGHQAIEKIKGNHPDLVILDLMLPKLDGYKVCRLIKFDERTRNIPVLIFTARAQAEDVALATECGANGYLNKPFSPDALLSKLKELLGGVQASS